MAVTPAGQRDRLIRFERATVTRTALGGKTPTSDSWAPLGTGRVERLAKVLWGSGSERRAAAIEQSVQPATFRVLADSLTNEVRAKDRIVDIGTGLIFDISGFAPIGREIEFTGTASRG